MLRIKRVTDASGTYSVESMVVSVSSDGQQQPQLQQLQQQQQQQEQPSVEGHNSSAGGSFAGKSRRVGAMFVFGEHARELISAEIGLRLVAMVCAPWAALRPALPPPLDELHRKAEKSLSRVGYTHQWLTALLGAVDLQLVPVENPNGRRMVEGPRGKLCHRMNGRHVDINRNFDNHFGVHPPEYLPSEEYEGKAAFSEPEARITRDLANGLASRGSFDAFVSIHAGIREMYLPFDHKPEVTTEPAINAVLAAINKKHCHCRTGSSAKIGGYKAFGTACVNFGLLCKQLPDASCALARTLVAVVVVVMTAMPAAVGVCVRGYVCLNLHAYLQDGIHVRGDEGQIRVHVGGGRGSASEQQRLLPHVRACR
jgi:hypothetical protein